MGHREIVFSIMLFSVLGLLIPPTFAHPLDRNVSTMDVWEATKFFNECDPVIVKAEISKVWVHWNHTTTEQQEDFNDGSLSWSGGEVEVIYKMWEPGHASTPDVLGSKGKAVGSVILEDWEIDFITFFFTDDYEKKMVFGIPVAYYGEEYDRDAKSAGAIREVQSKIEKKYYDAQNRVTKRWEEDSHQKYYHVTCMENLNSLVIAFAASELDYTFYTPQHKIDNLLGGKEIEQNVLREATTSQGLRAWSTERWMGGAVDYVLGAVQGKIKGVVVGTAEDRITTHLTAGAFTKLSDLKAARDRILREFTEETAETIVGRVATQAAKKIGSVFSGPVGWVLLVVDVAQTAYEIYNWGNQSKGLLGYGVWHIPLADLVGTERKEFEMTTSRSYEILCEGKITNSMVRSSLAPDPEGIAPVTGSDAPPVRDFVFKYEDCRRVQTPSYYLEKYENDPYYKIRVDSTILSRFPGVEFSEIVDIMTRNVEYGTVDEYLYKKIVETEPKLSGTVTVTVKVSVKPVTCGLRSFSNDSSAQSFSPIPAHFDAAKSISLDNLHYALLDSGFSDSARFHFISTESENKQSSIPAWIKNNADWWSQGLISDTEFVNGIEYLVESKIITSTGLKVVEEIKTKYMNLNARDFELPKARGLTTEVTISGTVENYVRGEVISIVIEKPDGTIDEQQVLASDGNYVTQYYLHNDHPLGEYKIITKYKEMSDVISFSTSSSDSKIKTKFEGSIAKDIQVPSWIKNSAKWWASGEIRDEDFINGIEFMVLKNIITTPRILVVDPSQILTTEPATKPEVVDELEPKVSQQPKQEKEGVQLPTQEDKNKPESKIISIDPVTGTKAAESRPVSHSLFEINDYESRKVLMVDGSSEIVLDDYGDFKKAVVNWRLEYKNGLPTADKPIQIVIDDETIVNKVTDDNGNLIYEFGSLTPPGIHSAEIIDLGYFADAQYFGTCYRIEVTVPEKKSYTVIVDQKSVTSTENEYTFRWHFVSDDGSPLPKPKPGDAVLVEGTWPYDTQSGNSRSYSIFELGLVLDEDWNIFQTAKYSLYEKGAIQYVSPSKPGDYTLKIIGNSGKFSSEEYTYIGDGDMLTFTVPCGEWKPEYCARFN